MITFDPTKIRVDIVALKAVTTALGGSISVINEDESEGKKEVLKRIPVPMAVARAFIIACKKTTKYLRPVYTAVVSYDDVVVCLERHPLASMGAKEELVDGVKRRWIPMCESVYASIVKPLVERGDRSWYFDGRYIYSFDTENLEQKIKSSDALTVDGRFRKVVSSTIDLMSLSNREKIEPQDRSCLAFTASRGFAISPPIWKNLSEVGSRALGVAQMGRGGEDAGEEIDDYEFRSMSRERIEAGTVVSTNFNFDDIDKRLAVNLNFALKAGSEIGKTFGYEFVEPLHLPRLMTELHTVNLPNIPHTVKATYDIGLQFTHALAWLLGMSRKANTLETAIMMRSLMKYLTQKGIFRNDVFSAENVFKKGKSLDDIKQKKMEELMAGTDEEFTRRALSALLAQARRKGGMPLPASDEE